MSGCYPITIFCYLPDRFIVERLVLNSFEERHDGSNQRIRCAGTKSWLALRVPWLDVEQVIEKSHGMQNEAC
ncbi:hypothetical protein EAF00_008347 [Botryotinia globosa]|nr:hypothetical protein EAF00_008347 [Botryotinia globosa]